MAGSHPGLQWPRPYSHGYCSSTQKPPLESSNREPTAMANACIDHHIALDGSLLPTVKFVRHPPHCFNCHHTGHFTCSCKAQRSCGLCAGDHGTRHCRSSRRDGPASHFALLKCALCCAPHAASDDSCPARKAAVDKYWTEVTSASPYYLLPK